MNRCISTLRRTRWLALASALIASSAPAQQATFRSPLVDKLVGTWVLTGTIHGKQTTHEVRAEWVLNHQYVRIDEVSREKDGAGQPQYAATIFVGWDETSKQFVAVWLDIWGGASPQSIGYAKQDGNTLPFVFKGPDDLFHTTFAWDAKTDTWQWRMDSEANGKLTPFARVTLARR